MYGLHAPTGSIISTRLHVNITYIRRVYNPIKTVIPNDLLRLPTVLLINSRSMASKALRLFMIRDH